jgi:hypothetical protein
MALTSDEIGIDLRAQRDALIANENARSYPPVAAPAFNKAPHFVLRLAAERTGRLLRRGGSGHLAASIRYGWL